jgi:uncharacterized protein
MRNYSLLLILLLIVSLNVSAQISASDTGLKQGKNDLNITMSDGTELATDIYLPEKKGRVPVILVRTPYDKASEEWMGNALKDLGIAAVVQDCRGKFRSGGNFVPFVNERSDGLQTLRWIRKQSWSDGRIGGRGGSYVGYTQWAISDSLDFMTPLLTGARLYDLFYPDSLFSLHLAFEWGFLNASQTMNSIPAEKLAASLKILPLGAADDSTFKDTPFITDWLQHQSFDKYWKDFDYRGIARAPFISVAGWYDIFLKAQIDDFEALNSTVNGGRLIIGPWCHGNPAEKNNYGGTGKTGDLSMLFEYEKDFLTGKKISLKPPLKDKKYNLFIMERNEYVGSDVWPPRETAVVPYYLGPENQLRPDLQRQDGYYQYVYDPADPFPSIGGTILGEGVGPARQNASTGRKDQAFFVTKIIEEPLTLLGPVTATLWVSGSTPCTDFIVEIQDVFPDGKIINIQEGGARVRFKGEGPQKEEISVWATGYQLNKGHRLRMIIASSWFPRYARNLNTCEPVLTAEKMMKASQKIWYGRTTPSSINLPVYKPSVALK